MTEKQMEDLLWLYPQELLREPVRQFRRQMRSEVGRLDLVFEEPHGGLLIVEIKKGTVERTAIGQILDYFGAVKMFIKGDSEIERAVEMMLVANRIPDERRLVFESHRIECKEIPDFRFQELAREKGYPLAVDADDSAFAARVTEPQLTSRTSPANPRKADAESNLRSEGFGGACDVVHALVSILKEFDPGIEPLFVSSLDMKTRYAVLGRGGQAIWTGSPASGSQPIHFTLWKGRKTPGEGNVKISAKLQERDRWLEEFSRCGFAKELLRKRSIDDGRTRLNSVTLALVDSCREVFVRFFKAVLTQSIDEGTGP